MKARIAIVSVALSLILLLVAGCLWTPDLDEVQSMVARQIEPATMKTEVKLSLGSTALSLAKLITVFADVDAEARSYLSHIDHVDINVQEISGLSSVRDIHWPDDVMKSLEDEGWEILVKAREDDEIVFVLYKPHRNTIRQMYVMALSLDELVLVKIEGSLDAMMAQAMEDHGFAREITGVVH